MYKYEMHCHTSEGSACGKLTAAQMVEVYKNAGYDGIVITDHFFNGNTAVPRELPWEERTELFEAGYRNAAEKGKELGIDVFFAWEISFCGTDFLIYGLDKQWVLDHPDCDKLTLGEFADLAHESGAYVVHAHPFREAAYIDMIRLLPRKVDAVETINACRTDFENKMADEYAENYALPKFCGTDNHIGIRERMAALVLQEKAKSLLNIIDAVKADRYKVKLYEMTEDGKLGKEL